MANGKVKCVLCIIWGSLSRSLNIYVIIIGALAAVPVLTIATWLFRSCLGLGDWKLLGLSDVKIALIWTTTLAAVFKIFLFAANRFDSKRKAERDHAYQIVDAIFSILIAIFFIYLTLPQIGQ